MTTMMCCLCAYRDVGAIQKRGRSDLISLARERLYRPQTAWRVKRRLKRHTDLTIDITA